MATLSFGKSHLRAQEVSDRVRFHDAMENKAISGENIEQMAYAYRYLPRLYLREGSLANQELGHDPMAKSICTQSYHHSTTPCFMIHFNTIPPGLSLLFTSKKD